MEENASVTHTNQHRPTITPTTFMSRSTTATATRWEGPARARMSWTPWKEAVWRPFSATSS